MQDGDKDALLLAEPGAGARMEEAVAYLVERLFDAGLSPSSVAGHVGLDLSRFCRLFREATGMTCGEFIAKSRMEEARRLLARRDLLIKQVAFRVGFEDPNYFSRRFKRLVGLSPASYRRLGRSPGR